MALGPPSSGWSVKFVANIGEIVGNGAVWVKEGGGAFAFSVKKGVGGAGFAVFAGLALFVISTGGDNVDMTGEKHGSEAVHAPAPAATAPASPAPASK